MCLCFGVTAACPSILGKNAAKKNQITSTSSKQVKHSYKLASPKIDRPSYSSFSLALSRRDEEALPKRILSRTFSDSWRHRRDIINFKANFFMSFWSPCVCAFLCVCVFQSIRFFFPVYFNCVSRASQSKVQDPFGKSKKKPEG